MQIMRQWVLILGLALGVALASAPAGAFTVNTTSDLDDGSCDPAPADCTLREAIGALNAAGRGTIDFDALIFPRHSPSVISPRSPLPPITASRSSVDGDGAGVFLDGSGLLGNEPGLAFESGPGVPLSNVTLRAIILEGFFYGSGVLICGGEYPFCNESVSRVLVERISSLQNAHGIQIFGALVDRVRVNQTVVRKNDNRGIAISGDTLRGVVVEHSVARDNGSTGIWLNALMDNEGTRITDSVTSGNSGRGIELSAVGSTRKPQLVGNVAQGNQEQGIGVFAGSNVEGAKLLDNVASGNLVGISLSSGEDLIGPQLKGNVASDNAAVGIELFPHGESSRAKVTGNRTNANGTGMDLHVSHSTISGNTASANSGSGISLSGPANRNKVQRNVASGNSRHGISLSTNRESRLQRNEAHGNIVDLADDSSGCDGNVWSGNRFEWASKPCIH